MALLGHNGLIRSHDSNKILPQIKYYLELKNSLHSFLFSLVRYDYEDLL